MSKKATTLDTSPVKKNIELPRWVVDEFDEMAMMNRNKFKPFVELTIIGLAKKYLNAKEKMKASSLK